MNRYIAFLDILGFADFVKNEQLHTVKERVNLALEWSKKAAITAPQIGFDGTNVRGVHRFSFSDTFVFLSEDESEAAFLSFLNATTLLTRALFTLSLPVRGAITFGEADFIEGTGHAVGKGIITAAELEKDQDWLGVLVDETTLPAAVRPMLDSTLFAPVFARWDVPLKPKPKLPEAKRRTLPNARVVNWLYNVRLNSSPESRIRPATDPDARRKIRATLAFADHILKSGLHKGRDCVLDANQRPIFTPSLEGIGWETYNG